MAIEEYNRRSTNEDFTIGGADDCTWMQAYKLNGCADQLQGL